jgi:hypothetical protein
MPFSPTDISGCKLWLDAGVGVLDASDAPCTDGVAVKTWQDQSGQGNHVVQAISGNQPAFKTSCVNGLPAIQFALQSYTERLGTAGTVDLTAGASVFVVAKNRVRRDYNVLLTQGAADGFASHDVLHLYWQAGTSGSGNPFFGVNNFTAYIGSHNRGPAVDGEFYILSAVTSRHFFLDGAEQSVDEYVGTFVPPNSARRIWIGGYDGVFAPKGALDGDVAEVVVYDSALSTSDRQSVEAYLTAKYFVVPGGLLLKRRRLLMA